MSTPNNYLPPVPCTTPLGMPYYDAAGNLQMYDSQDFCAFFNSSSTFEKPINFSIFGSSFDIVQTKFIQYLIINSLFYKKFPAPSTKTAEPSSVQGYSQQSLI